MEVYHGILKMYFKYVVFTEKFTEKMWRNSDKTEEKVQMLYCRPFYAKRQTTNEQHFGRTSRLRSTSVLEWKHWNRPGFFLDVKCI